MATTLTQLRLDLILRTVYRNDLDLSLPQQDHTQSDQIRWTDGDAADKAEIVYMDSDSVAASGTDAYDLAGGLADAFGNTLTFTKLKAIYVRNKSTTAGDVLRVTRPTNGVPFLTTAGDAAELGPGGILCLVNPSAAGWTVTAATGDLIHIIEAGGANTVSYDIILVGTD